MDPNLFHLDWERTLEALVGIVVLSFVVERACAILFQSRWWIKRFEEDRIGTPLAKIDPAAAPKDLPARKYPLKEIIALALSIAICWFWQFDAVSIIMLSEKTQIAGIIITGAVVAGGSKGSMALFNELLPFMSAAEKERRALRESASKK